MTDDAPRSPSEEERHWELLARYLVGECSPDEAAAVRRRLAGDPADAALVAALDDAMHRLPSIPRDADVDVEAALRRVRARLAKPRRSWFVPALAAAAVVFVAASALLWSRAHGDAGRGGVLTAGAVFRTAVGRVDSVRLGDGSRVVLGPGSELRVASDQRDGRVVELRGEALFDVKHDAVHPFVVRAGAATIRDVGTTFAVHADEAGEVRVAVTAGEVRLSPSSAPSDPGVVLSAGDVGTLGAAGRVEARPGHGTGDDLAWTSGRLVFRDATLDDVRSDLRRWYGVEFVVADSTLGGRHVTAAFDGASARQVVRDIALALGVGVRWHGDSAVIGTTAEGMLTR